MREIERYKYRAINAKGRPVRGTISAASENDLYNQLQTAGLELISGSPLSRKKGMQIAGLKMSRIKLRDLIQLFIHMEQMQSAGVPLLDALSDIRDSTDNDMLRDLMSEIVRDVTDGSALSEAMALHPKVFNNLYISLIKAGEDTGDLTSSYKQLVKYLKWVDEMQSKVRKATRYPIVVTVVVLAVVFVMMTYVVPQIVGFLDNLDIELPFYSRALIATADFFAKPLFHIGPIPVFQGLLLVLTPFFIMAVAKLLKSLSSEFAYRIDYIALNMPLAGNLIRKISIARYAQTFGALFASGIDVLSALKSARQTVNNLVLLDAVESVEDHVKAGTPLSDSFNACGEFPSLVVRMVKVGEESGNLSVVLEQVSDFYTKDVDEAVQAMITMIEPLLTVLLGGMILWIAAGSLGPIYMNLGNMVDF